MEMSIYRKLTKKYLLRNQKRTFFTLLGIILSIALITSIGTFLISFQQYSVKQTKSDYGSFHLKIKHANSKLLKRLQENPQINKVGVLSKNTFHLSNGETFNLKTIDDEAYKLLPFHAVHEYNKNGIAIEKWVSAKLQRDNALNEPLVLLDKTGTRSEFSIHEIVKNNQNLRDGKVLQGFRVQKTIKELEDIELYIELKYEANFQEVYEFVQTQIPKKNIEVNAPLIGIVFSNDNQRYILTSVVYYLPISIVIIASIAFIFNSFQISIIERIREIGLLRTIGATKKQIKKLVIYEMSIFGMVGIPLGLIIGILGFWIIAFLYQLLFEETEISLFYLQIVISPMVIMLSCSIGIFSLIISGLIPLKVANRISPLVAIKSSMIHKGYKTGKTKKLFQSIAGIELTMAFRNIRRNKLRSIIIIFSLALSLFLFTCFSSIVMYMIKSDSEEYSNSSLRVYLHEPTQLPGALWKEIEGISEIQEKYIHYTGLGTLLYVPHLKTNPSQVNSNRNKIDKKQLYSVYTNSIPITEENMPYLRNRLVSGSLNKEIMVKDHGVVYAKSKDAPSLFHLGDEVSIQTRTRQDGQYGPMQKVRISGIVELNQSENLLLTYPEVLASLGNPTVQSISLYLENNREIEKVYQILSKKVEQSPNLKIINETKSKRNQSLLEIQIQILLFGFVIAIGVIGILNIINTTTMNIILRRKEYATLRAIGMSMKSIRKMIVKEGLLYGIMSGIIGMAASGVIELYLVINNVKTDWGIHLYIVSFLVLVGICYLSAKLSSRMIKTDNEKRSLRNE